MTNVHDIFSGRAITQPLPAFPLEEPYYELYWHGVWPVTLEPRKTCISCRDRGRIKRQMESLRKARTFAKVMADGKVAGSVFKSTCPSRGEIWIATLDGEYWGD